jgi:ClpP class serine protease
MHWAVGSLTWSKSIEGWTASAWTAVADARVFLADAAVTVGLVDKIGYLSGMPSMRQKRLAAIDADARVVTYRRTRLSQRQPLQYPHQRFTKPVQHRLSTWAPSPTC